MRKFALVAKCVIEMTFSLTFEGPTFTTPLTLENMNSLDLRPNVAEKLKYVYDAITLLRCPNTFQRPTLK